MKKLISTLLMIACIFSLTSCSTGGTKNASHTEPVKKVDYLYEISYDKYDWNVSKESLIKLPEGNLEGFGCSSVRNGNYYGRNFDFTFNNMSEFVVRSTAGKYKNIGIAIANVNSTPEEVERGLSADQYNVLPFSVVDGINEKGVVCNANVVPVNDVVADGGSRTTGTNPGKEDYFYQFLCRYILDNAATADEALDLITNKINVTNTIDGHNCDYYTLNHAGFELHYMVADANKTYVIEFVNNEVRYTEDNVMTNYYLTYGTAPDYTPHACGLERYDTFKEHYSEGISAEGMASLMRRCQYSLIAKIDDNDINTNVKWYSDLTNDAFSRDAVKDMFDNYPEIMMQMCNAAYDVFAENKRNGETNHIEFELGGLQEMDIGAPWQTTHSCVYDMENKTLRLVTQEKYDRVMYYSLEE